MGNEVLVVVNVEGIVVLVVRILVIIGCWAS
jgi:hypothetical protein